MAQRIVTVDDLDGSSDAVTTVFSVDGTTYEIDLSEANRAKLLDALAPFIDKARKTAKPAAKRNRKAAGNGAEIREWAAANGHKVSSRGKVPQEVIDAFNAR